MIRPLRAVGILLALGVPIVALAADHGDVPASLNEPTADITDLYAWMTADATKLNVVVNVDPDASADDAFSDAVIYQVSVSSSPAFGQPQQSTLITCKFVDGINIECWVGNDYVVGDPSVDTGVLSDNGGLRVFAGLRDDPFFLEYTGFGNTIAAANAAVAANQVSFPAENQGCPALTPDQRDALLATLTHGANGAPPSNYFAGQNVLALVIQVDKSIVNAGGPVLGVSASTYSSN